MSVSHEFLLRTGQPLELSSAPFDNKSDSELASLAVTSEPFTNVQGYFTALVHTFAGVSAADRPALRSFLFARFASPDKAHLLFEDHKKRGHGELKTATGIRFEGHDKQAGAQSLDDINAVLAPVGARIWRQDWSGLSDDLKTFLSDPDPSPERVAEVMPHFLLSRQRLLEVIVGAGRKPHVPGGGELTTLDETHGVTLPQLYVARQGADFSRFDRMHVNTAADGTPVDDVSQLLSGGDLIMHFLMPAGKVVKVHLACPTIDAGWLLTVDCAKPFIGSLSSASVGTKCLSQVIGPARWNMVYVE